MSNSASSWSERHENLFSNLLLVLAVLVFLGFYFKVASIHGINTDEGFYGWGAQHFADGDIMLTKAKTDKPPLIFQILGLSLMIFGRSTMTLKIPNAIALAALLLLTYALGKRFFGRAAGLLAVVLMATSPYMAEEGIGAMTDPIATLLLTASLYAALRGRPLGSGLWLGLSICTRQMSLFFLPVSLVAGWMSSGGRGHIKLMFKRFTAGLALPILYLLTWSAFFEKQRFRWLWREVLLRKAFAGQEQAPSIMGRLSFWLSTTGDFFISHAVWWIGLGCLVVIAVLTVINKRRGNEKISSSQAKLLLLFGGIIVFYLVGHTLIGIPLYPRMMFPLLPLLVLTISFATVRAAELLIPQRKPPWKVVGLLILTALLIGGTVKNMGIQSKLKPYDDLPEAAQIIEQLPEKKKLVITKDWNRQLHFLLHSTGIKLKQYWDKPLTAIVDGYPEYEQFLILSGEEHERLAQIAESLAPRYELSHVATATRRLAWIYRIRPNARIVTEGGESYIEVTTEQGKELIPLTAQSVAQKLAAYVSEILRSGGPPAVIVEPHPTLPMSQGYLKRIELRAPKVILQKVPCEEMTVRYENPRIDLAKLFAAGRLVVLEAEKVQGKVATGERELSGFIDEMNPNIRDAELTVTGDGIGITGQVELLGKTYPFALDGSLFVDDRGWVNIRSRAGRLGTLSAPSFILTLLDKTMNPVFKPKSKALGLKCSALKLENGRIRFLLKPTD